MKASVCIATYNGARYLREQMDSILNQEFHKNPDVEMEIIVSDDGSSDDTIKILEAYNDPRIKIYHHTEHKLHRYNKNYFACTENFAFALSKASGDYIFFSDQDDVWYPWKLDWSISVLSKTGGVVGTAFMLGDANLKKIGLIKYHYQSFFTLKFKHSLYGFSCGFTRDMLKYIMPIPDVPQHDTFIMLTALWHKNLHFIDEPCAIHRWTGEHNVSSNSDAPAYVKLWYRAKMWLTVIWRAIAK